MLVARVLCFTSMTGDTAVTFTVSETPATDSEKSSVFTCPSATRTSGIFALLKPASDAVTSYVPI